MTSVHSTISPSQGKIANVKIVHSAIPPSQGVIANVTYIHFTILSSQGDISSGTSERLISSEILVETINGFNELAIQLTINDSAYCDSEEDDAESDPNSDTKLST